MPNSKKNALCVKLFGDDLFELCSKHWSPTAQGGLRTLSPRRRRAFSRSFHWMGQCDWRGRRFESTWAKWHICLVLLKACRDTSLQILVYIYIHNIFVYTWKIIGQTRLLMWQKPLPVIRCHLAQDAAQLPTASRRKKGNQPWGKNQQTYNMKLDGV